MPQWVVENVAEYQKRLPRDFSFEFTEIASASRNKKTRASDAKTQEAKDYTKAEMSERERGIADFTVKVTRSPNTCSPFDIQRLREQGLSEMDILSLVEIIAYQNMSTRIMESLSPIE